MSEQDIIDIELQKNTFYRDKFRMLMKLNVLLVLSAAALSGVFFYQSVKPAQVHYFGSTTTGEQTTLNALSDPVITNSLITQWASMTSKKIYSLSLNEYADQTAALKPYFTSAGWSSYQKALSDSGLLDAVKNQKLEVNAVTTNDPVIEKSGVKAGVRYWVVEMPILISFESANEVAPQHMVISMTVVRSKDIKAPSGLQVKRLAVSYNN